MSQLEANRPRRVVIDVVSEQEKPRPQHHRRKHGKKKHKHVHQHDRQDYSSIEQSVPLELTPLIQAALEYGRKTHALGALKAAQTLSDIVKRLKAIGLVDPDVITLISDAERESRKINSMFMHAYEEEETAM